MSDELEEKGSGAEPPPNRWYQPHDPMKHFTKDKPLVKLCALGMVMFPRSAFAIASAAGVVWRLTHGS